MSALSDKTELQRCIHQRGMTYDEIASKHDVSDATVCRRVKEFGIDTSLDSLTKTVENGYTYYESGGRSISVHQLVAISDGADPHEIFHENGKHVHHIDGVKLNSWDDNLIPLTSEEHGLVEHSDFEVDKESGIIYKPLDEL